MDGLKSKFSTSTKGGKVKLPSAFPEKGLYMLAKKFFGLILWRYFAILFIKQKGDSHAVQRSAP